jgi:hypothetical protein
MFLIYLWIYLRELKMNKLTIANTILDQCSKEQLHSVFSPLADCRFDLVRHQWLVIV